MTVKNEMESLPRLLESLRNQTRTPNQVIIVDGGSTDGTLALLNRHKKSSNLTVIECPGANISQGRNAAIAQANAEIIASTDAGVRLDSRWLEKLTEPFIKDQPPDVVGGFFEPDPHGVFETALAATTLPALRDVRAEMFLPSSRSVAFLKTAWEKVSGYPEWLDYCEDLVFDLALRRAGMRFQFAPEARVYFRPRPTLAKFFRQYYLYARGDGKANLWFERHLVRYVTYFVVLPISLWLLTFLPWIGIMILLGGGAAMFATPYRRLLDWWGKLGPGEKLAAIALVPLIRVTGDFAKMIGYPVGVWWRLRARRTQT